MGLKKKGHLYADALTLLPHYFVWCHFTVCKMHINVINSIEMFKQAKMPFYVCNPSEPEFIEGWTCSKLYVIQYFDISQ